MKKFLLFLFFIFNIHSLSVADDIGDFEIEGLSIGDSLLDLASDEQIRSAKSNSQYPNDKYIVYEVDKFIKSSTYTKISATTKKNDEKYIITSLSGLMYFKDLNECLNTRKKIKSDVEKLLNFDDVEEAKYKSQDGKATIHAIQFYLKPYPLVEAIVLNCKVYFSGQDIRLSTAVNPEEYAYFLINEAYK